MPPAGAPRGRLEGVSHPLRPLLDAWPAAVALLLLVATVRVRRPRAAFLAWAAIALGVRLWVVPAWAAHGWEGHEAWYWELFSGERAPSQGDTVLYPAMQALWWGLGRLLPHDPRVPVVLMALVGTAAAGALAGAVGRQAGRHAGWMAAAILALHPVQAAWSSSAYPVILPHLFGCLALYRVADGGRGLAAGAALALAVSTRLDAAVWIAPVAVLANRRQWPGLGLGVLLAGAAAWPVLAQGDLPGTAAWARVWGPNLLATAPFQPFDRGVGLAAFLLSAVVSWRIRPRAALGFLLTLPVTWLLMAAFVDEGERHALHALPAFAWAFGAGTVGLVQRLRWRRLALFPAGLGVAVCALGLADLRKRYYGDTAAFLDALGAAPFSALPRRTDPFALDLASRDCGWVDEAGPRAGHTALDLLDPQVAARLRVDGCLRWCYDLDDWRWSSRAVHSRARRIAELYRLTPEAVLRDPTTGYTCLLLWVGASEPRPWPWADLP